MNPRLLSDTKSSVVTLDTTTNIVKVERKSTTINVEELIAWVKHMESLIQKSKRSQLAVLQNMHNAPLLDDPAKEKAIREHVGEFFSEFGARAIVVQTAVGKLQATRTTQTTTLPPGIFNDVSLAENYLIAELAKKKPR